MFEKLNFSIFANLLAVCLILYFSECQAWNLLAKGKISVNIFKLGKENLNLGAAQYNSPNWLKESFLLLCLSGKGFSQLMSEHMAK